MNYYNDCEPFAVQWLKNLISSGMIPPGIVDTRPIQEVTVNDLAGFTQCHFFAGIGGWSVALKLAGWHETWPIWSGSCPCQPFSVAGKGKGESDHRHLWPEFRRLIAEGKPPVVIGEQVASADGRDWLSGVRLNLEGMGYEVGAADLCAPGAGQEETILLVGRDGIRRESVHIGPPHIRQRLFWVADAEYSGHNRPERTEAEPDCDRENRRVYCGGSGGSCTAPSCEPAYCRLGNTVTTGLEGFRTGIRDEPRDGGCGVTITSPSDVGWVGNTKCRGLQGWSEPTPEQDSTFSACRCKANWSIIPCGDGKARRIKSGLMPLVNGFPGRVGLIRGYGNAIVPTLAAEFIKAYMEITCTP